MEFANENSNRKNIEMFGQRSDRIIRENNINTIVIFGMNIE